MSGAVQPKEETVFSGYYDSLPDREAIAVELAERIAGDPHSVTDEFWAELKEQFTEEEIVELVFACSIFNWGNKFNITMRLDSDEQSNYPRNMSYKDADTFWRGAPS